ncbi:hypothetical protein MLD38_040407 [Melastoma candidum]|uniref:Uncharacterized protein n=1 Tax=Melastoma candidum TaxID=119954 RepID=A0ACB9L5U7_9MYRT|nr:hypothetical protein MLD38_040407 [Melastoma candidum]
MEIKSTIFFLILALTCSPLQAALPSLPSCSDLVKPVAPCFPYLKGHGGLTSVCCNGVGGLIATARTKPGLELICYCLQDALKDAVYDPNLIPTLSTSCGFGNIGLPPISRETNCAGI